jgi:hypothetical protein
VNDQPTIEVPIPSFALDTEPGDPTLEAETRADLTAEDITREARTTEYTLDNPTLVRPSAAQPQAQPQPIKPRIRARAEHGVSDLLTPDGPTRFGKVSLPGSDGPAKVDLDRPAAQRFLDLGEVIAVEGAKIREQRRRSRTLGVVLLAVLGAAALIGVVALIIGAVGGDDKDERKQTLDPAKLAQPTLTAAPSPAKVPPVAREQPQLSAARPAQRSPVPAAAPPKSAESPAHSRPRAATKKSGQDKSSAVSASASRTRAPAPVARPPRSSEKPTAPKKATSTSSASTSKPVSRDDEIPTELIE